MKSWKTNPNVPSKSMIPLSLVSKPVMHLSNVDLPEPDGPIIHKTSPLSTLREISFNTSFLSKLFLRFLISNKLMIFPPNHNNPIFLQCIPLQMQQLH